MWYIYGNEYDLTPFINEHPGGSYILNITKGMKDITTQFEIYHPFANRIKLIEMLEKYRVNKVSNSFTYNYNNDNVIKVNHYEYNEIDYEFLLKLDKYEKSHYYNIINIIKKKYETKFHAKASPQFILYTILIFSLYLFCFYFSMLSDYNIIFRMFLSIVSGFLWSIILINVMNNSQSYALTSSANMNYRITKFINNFSLWNNMNFYISDCIKINGIIIPKNKYIVIDNSNNIIIRSKYFVLNIVNYFNLSIDTIECIVNSFNFNLISYYDKYDLLIMSIYYYILYCGGIIPSSLYSITFNSIYSIVTNYNEDIEKNESWIIKTIYGNGNKNNSTNYINKIYNNINYKLEKQLFPTICSEYYMDISNIIINYCYNNNIKYKVEDIIPTINSIDKYV